MTERMMNGFVRTSLASARFGLVLIGAVALPGCSMMFPPTVKSGSISDLPKVDGVVEKEWENAKSLRITTKPNTPEVKPTEVEVRSLHDKERVTFLIRWEDTTPSTSFRGWSARDGGSPKIEGGSDGADDQLAIMLKAPDMTFHSCMLSGHAYENDVWAWKAARTDPSGHAEDKRLRIEVSEKSQAADLGADGPKEYVARHGMVAAISWPMDSGNPLVIEHPEELDAATAIPSFEIKPPDGSQADIEAKGQWVEGIWTLEISRLLNTGHDDDVVIVPEETQKFALAVFDHADGPTHSNTRYLKLKLK